MSEPLRQRNSEVHFRILAIELVAFGATLALKWRRGESMGADLVVIIAAFLFAAYALVTTIAMFVGMRDYRYGALVTHAAVVVAVILALAIMFMTR